MLCIKEPTKCCPDDESCCIPIGKLTRDDEPPNEPDCCNVAGHHSRCMEQTKPLVIQRSRWLRGDQPSYLKRESDGKRCCLGFYALQQGFTEVDILNLTTPAALAMAFKGEELAKQRMSKLILGFPSGRFAPFYTDNEVCSNLMAANDRSYTNEATREKDLKVLFKSIGVEVEFVD